MRGGGGVKDQGWRGPIFRGITKVHKEAVFVNEGGGACEVLPLRKRGGGKSFSHAEGGHNKFWGSLKV